VTVRILTPIVAMDADFSDCQSPVTYYVKNETSGYYDIRIVHYDIMINTTACIDGTVF
jgi:hypothetical protein